MHSTSLPRASVLLVTVIIIAVLSLVSASILTNLGHRYRASFHSSSWQEAVIVAESGADLGMSALNASIANPSTAWSGWTPADAATFPKTYSGKLSPHGGIGNQQMYLSVTIDDAISDSNGATWFRIRSTGTTTLPGSRSVTLERSLLTSAGKKNHTNLLRLLFFSKDQTGGALTLPQTSRTVEIVAQPATSSVTLRPILAKTTITMSGGAYTDSFNSSDPLKSTNGQYDPAKRQKHGDIATTITGNQSDLGSCYIYGNASSNGGAFVKSTNVQGTIYNNFSTTVPPISDPSFSSVNSTPTTVYNPHNPVTLTAGTASAPANYVLSAINISNKQNPLILAPPASGQPGYINVWVKGNVNTSGNGYIQIMSGVQATFYVDGDISVSGGAFDNENGIASSLTIYGVTPSDGSTRNYTVSGNSTFVGVINAPAFNFQLTGTGDVMGSVIANQITITGAAGFHYDEALAHSLAPSTIVGYTVGSWVEDIRN